MTSRRGRRSTTCMPPTGPPSASPTGPLYQDIDNPKAAMFHIKTDDMERAMQWFKTDTFKGATKLAKVTGRTFYLAQPQA